VRWLDRLTTSMAWRRLAEDQAKSEERARQRWMHGVEAEHTPFSPYEDEDGDPATHDLVCRECYEDWPCRTVELYQAHGGRKWRSDHST